MQRLQNARALVFGQNLRRVGVECRRHGIRISGLKEHQILWWKYGFILSDCIIDTVFPGILFKSLQVCFGNVDIGDALILTDQLLNGLLAGGLLIFHCRFLRFSLDISDTLQAKTDNAASRKLGRADGQIHCPVFYFLLQCSPPPSVRFSGIMLFSRRSPPPS